MPATTPFHPTVHGYPYNRRALAAQHEGNQQLELRILLEGVARRADTPYTYDRSAALLERDQRFEDALRVCETWFTVPPRTRSSAQVTEGKIAERRSRLLAQLGRDPATPLPEPARLG